MAPKVRVVRHIRRFGLSGRRILTTVVLLIEPFLHLGADRPKLITNPDGGDNAGVNRLNVDETLCHNGQTSDYISHDCENANIAVGAAQSPTAPLAQLHTLHEHMVTTHINEHTFTENLPSNVSQPLKGNLHTGPPSEPHHSARKTLARLVETHKWNCK
jgi:hypothetical protein